MSVLWFSDWVGYEKVRAYFYRGGASPLLMLGIDFWGNKPKNGKETWLFREIDVFLRIIALETTEVYFYTCTLCKLRNFTAKVFSQNFRQINVLLINLLWCDLLTKISWKQRFYSSKKYYKLISRNVFSSKVNSSVFYSLCIIYLE